MSIVDIYKNRFTSRTDSIGIWDQNWKQVFVDARPIACSVDEPSKNMEHPVETGAVITDHRIILPVEIRLSMIMLAVDYENIYKEIKQAYLAGTLFTVWTRTAGYENMMIVGMPHEETPENIDTITMALSFKEVIFVSPTFLPLPPSAVKNKDNGSTKEKGQVKASAPSAQTEAGAKGSLLKEGLGDSVKNAKAKIGSLF